MYRKILVPLDGSKAAECVFEPVRHVATPGSEVVLLGVAAKKHYDQLVQEPSLAACLDEELTRESDAYLADVAARLALPGVTVTRCVLAEQGALGALVVAFAREAKVDLVVVSAHGVTGLLGRFMGSMAEKIVHKAGVPVLVAHPSRK
jgi:nucleotide-binding universal stress UspA family protein